MKPQRIQLSRKKGFVLQFVSFALNGLPAVNCARPSRWGNPFVIQFDPHCDYSPQNASDAVRMFREWIHGKRFVVNTSAPTQKTIQLMLSGRNLACFCKPGDPCHCDVLLEIANA